MQDSSACRALCSSIGTAPRRLDLWGDHNAQGCRLTQPPAIKAKAGYGAITVNGFGRINGQKMMLNFSFKGQSDMWSDPKLTANAGFTNAYGNAVESMATIADAESHTRWRVHSGLLELSSAGQRSAASSGSGMVAKGRNSPPHSDVSFAISVRGTLSTC